MYTTAQTQNELLRVFTEHVHFCMWTKWADHGDPCTCTLLHIGPTQNVLLGLFPEHLWAGTWNELLRMFPTHAGLPLCCRLPLCFWLPLCRLPKMIPSSSQDRLPLCFWLPLCRLAEMIPQMTWLPLCGCHYVGYHYVLSFGSVHRISFNLPCCAPVLIEIYHEK